MRTHYLTHAKCHWRDNELGHNAMDGAQDCFCQCNASRGRCRRRTNVKMKTEKSQHERFW